MDLILCHTTADFDTLGAAVGLAYLYPGSRIVLTGGAHPAVKAFLALHRDEYPLIERRAVTVSMIRSIVVVDAHLRSRVGAAAEWIDYAIATHLPITIYDHHTESGPDIPGDHHIEAVGATTTLVVEALRQSDQSLSPTQATVMALGIHSDTGSLTFAQTQPRDVYALAWLMEQGANQQTISEAVEPGLSETLQGLLSIALDTTSIEQVEGYAVGTVYLETTDFVPGLSGLVSHLMALLGLDSLLLAAVYTAKAKPRLTLISRTRPQTGMNCRTLLQPYGGGGHSCAAAANLTTDTPGIVFKQLCDAIVRSHTQSVTAQDIMSSPVRTIRPMTTVVDAQRILLRYGHSGLCVADDIGKLQGIISRRDIDLALHHGFSHAPVKGYMTLNLKTVAAHTSLSEIQALMVTYDVGRLPVLDEEEELVGIVTRTDVLRQMYPAQSADNALLTPLETNVYERLKASLQAYPTALESEDLWTLLTQIATAAQQRGWHLYVVGGAVRDLLLAPVDTAVSLKDIDLVVDSFRTPVVEGAGVVLAQQLQTQYPDAELQVHGEFQTAALIWHSRVGHAPLMIDIATARTEFYPYPAANPEVEPSSIRQDLYRRDFTINAMAIRLTAPQPGLLFDFFGGYLDIQQSQVRVLHANSFIEDPTRIFRAVRFAVRLGFAIDSQTETFIHYAVDSGIYADLQAQQAKKRLPALQTRLKAELTYIFQADYWAKSLGLLDKLGALSCLHTDLTIDAGLWRQMHRAGRWRQLFVDKVGKDIDVEPWLLRLEVLLARVEVRAQIAHNLQLPLGSIQRLERLALVEDSLLNQFSHLDQPRPSSIYQILVLYDLSTLLLVSVRHPQQIGFYVWNYITQLRDIRPPIDGHHLKRLGYRPGPRYRQILTDLTYARLDGHITSVASAEDYLKRHYSLESD
ncbi:CBS domain-containing protein [Leptothoe spongobia]|uniref:CBS domain-containing protein n=1 Tax=Leptothoe spongobia TAU-MAC 1115 TaxID=1967444 RepID=A0A947GJ62_9CYAN|nr:CBS domain-containing protein [Leptothoe spongobia]MBT9315462.1 CBS domain-containing protein [Leptothoe spongobia TAU-MAC 1115]